MSKEPNLPADWGKAEAMCGDSHNWLPDAPTCGCQALRRVECACPECGVQHFTGAVRPNTARIGWFSSYTGEPYEIRPVTVRADDAIYNRSGKDEIHYLLFNEQGVSPIIYDTYGHASEQQTAARNFFIGKQRVIPRYSGRDLATAHRLTWMKFTHPLRTESSSTTD